MDNGTTVDATAETATEPDAGAVPAAGRQAAGRRSAGAASKEPVVSACIVALAIFGFVLEVAMLAAFVFWGFRQDSPWDLVLGIGIPAVLVVAWGVFLAPRSERRLKPAIVCWVALALFLLAAVALFAAGAALWGTLMALVSVGHFLGSQYVARQAH
ncbi:YrdB family protein [Specibacter sp. NPDC078709]|uniref:YrdB family protein n=1 Tax=Specibacter sp. NPDC078709 TaxID=3154364 RepID=UPI0034227F26